MKISANNIVLKILGLLLLTGAVLKGHELLTTPMANPDIWSNRYFMIFQVEFELALGIWLLSGLFKRAVWLVTLGCFALFCCVTLYKGISGAASCGCFGKVHINPWITLFAIDLPAIIALVVFRPMLSFLRRQESAYNIIMEFISPLPPWPHFVVTASVGLLTLAVTTPSLALNKPKTVTAQYEVLEPETWVGKELPILGHIDIGEQLKAGNWLVVLYHHECSSCAEAISKVEQMARDFEGNEDILRFALVEVPPYGTENVSPVSPSTLCTLGKLDTSKEWFVATPAICLISRYNIKQAWSKDDPTFKTFTDLFINDRFNLN